MDASAKMAAYVEEQTGYQSYCDVPPDRPREFVVLERTGGGRGRIVVEDYMFVLHCWAATRGRSAEMAEAVMDAVLAMPERLPNVFTATIESTYNNPDLDSGTPRTTITCTVSASH